jgi:hypothetical protein
VENIRAFRVFLFSFDFQVSWSISSIVER